MLASEVSYENVQAVNVPEPRPEETNLMGVGYVNRPAGSGRSRAPVAGGKFDLPIYADVPMKLRSAVLPTLSATFSGELSEGISSALS